jgi:hypothetical protein
VIKEAGERRRSPAVTGGVPPLKLEMTEHPLDPVAVPIAAEVAYDLL